MIGQAAGLAFLAALTPTALLVTAVYLGSANPRRTALLYLAGAVLTSIVMAVVILLALHAGGLNHPRHRTPRYGVRLGLGIIALAAGVVIARRKPKPAKPGKRPGLVDRMVASPSPLSAFAVGALLFAPSVTFIAAVQVIATARASAGLIVLALAVVIVINVMFVWLPIGFFLIAEEATARKLKAFNTWLRANGRTILACALIIAGALLAINGAAGLAG